MKQLRRVQEREKKAAWLHKYNKTGALRSMEMKQGKIDENDFTNSLFHNSKVLDSS